MNSRKLVWTMAQLLLAFSVSTTVFASVIITGNPPPETFLGAELESGIICLSGPGCPAPPTYFFLYGFNSPAPPPVAPPSGAIVLDVVGSIGSTFNF